MARMTAEQKAHLRDRINELYGYGPLGAAQKAARKPEPRDVKAARALVKRFDDSNTVVARRIEARFRKARQAANAAVLFMDPSDALAYVEKLQPLKVREV
jgi:AAA+ superfamily predicted ATPase